MIDINSPDYKEAKDRVKVSHFTEQGYNITGLVHVGANDGYEIEYYLKMGIKPVLALEPLREARMIAWKKYADNPDVIVLGIALGNIDATADLNIAPGDGKGSSFLHETGKNWSACYVERYPIHRWASLNTQEIDRSKYNCCVIDVQGMELDVLRGMDKHIKSFAFLSVECSEVPIYKGEACAAEVIAYLDRMGFDQDSPIAAHDDIMFVNRDVKFSPLPPAPIPKGTCLNVGSGQRPFDNKLGWINIDCVSRPGQVPDLLCDVGKEALPYPDGSMECVVLHQVVEHFGCNEAAGLVKEAYRVLKPGGSLLLFLPDLKALSQRWLTGQISDYIFFVNVYGAYMSEEGDRHRWAYTPDSLAHFLLGAAPWQTIKEFDWRTIPGSALARDWWVLTGEAVKGGG